MGWFSPVKGEYPGLAQVDKTLPVDGSVTELERGMLVAVAKGDGKNGDEGVWKAAGPADKLVYVALSGLDDPTAGFAGTSFDPKGGTPRVTGLDLAQDGEFETSVYENRTYEVGDPLYAKAGVLTNDGSGSDSPVVLGYVTMVPKARWINNAIAVPEGGKDQRLAIRTGATKTVLRFKTAV